MLPDHNSIAATQYFKGQNEADEFAINLAQDDIERLIRIKQDFLDALQDAKHHVSAEAFADHAIAIEQEVDDLLYDAICNACTRAKELKTLPMSEEYRAWLQNKHAMRAAIFAGKESV